MENTDHLRVRALSARDVQSGVVNLLDAPPYPLLPSSLLELPPHWRLVLQDFQNQSIVATNGNGACALHAGFGEPRNCELFCDRAREFASLALDECFSEFGNQESANAYFDSVIVSLWNEFALPMANYVLGQHSGLAVQQEARFFWQELALPHQQQICQFVEAQINIQHSIDQRDKMVDECLRRICTLDNESVCKQIGVALRHLPSVDRDYLSPENGYSFQLQSLAGASEFLSSPYLWNQSVNAYVVKGSKLVRCPDDFALKYVCKYEAMFDNRCCFDGLRRAFFIPQACQRKQIRDLIAQLAKECSKPEQWLQLSTLLEDRDPSVTSEPPNGFLDFAWPAYKRAIQHEGHGYYFSYNELLAISEQVHASMLILQIRHGFLSVVGHTANAAQPVAVVVLSNSGETAVRSHFQRLIPQTIRREDPSFVEDSQAEARKAEQVECATVFTFMPRVPVHQLQRADEKQRAVRLICSVRAYHVPIINTYVEAKIRGALACIPKFMLVGVAERVEANILQECYYTVVEQVLLQEERSSKWKYHARSSSGGEALRFKLPVPVSQLHTDGEQAGAFNILARVHLHHIGAIESKIDELLDSYFAAFPPHFFIGVEEVMKRNLLCARYLDIVKNVVFRDSEIDLCGRGVLQIKSDVDALEADDGNTECRKRRRDA